MRSNPPIDSSTLAKGRQLALLAAIEAHPPRLARGAKHRDVLERLRILLPTAIGGHARDKMGRRQWGKLGDCVTMLSSKAVSRGATLGSARGQHRTPA
eukprot:2022374-Prymnesium_polylepis.1